MTSLDDLNRLMVDRVVAEVGPLPQVMETAFRSTRRHLFLPGQALDSVYGGEAVPIKSGDDGLPLSSSSAPAIMATMLTQLDVRRGQRVLEVGTGSGYNAALLGALVGEAGRVTTVDIDADLVQGAAANLAEAGARNVRTVAGDGWDGVVDEAPYERIEVTVGVWDISPHWVEQLAEGGVLVVPLWLRAGVEASVALRRDRDRLVGLSARPCGFLRLRGPHAGRARHEHADGWLVCVDDESVPVDALSELLLRPADVTPAPTRGDGWFLGLALAEPHAVQMWTTTEPWAERQGVALGDGSGLALIEGDDLLTFGSQAAAEVLRESIARVEPVRLEDVTIDVYPSASWGGSAAADAFVRPNYTYVATLAPTRDTS